MTTVRNLVTDSLKELGTLAIGEVPSSAEGQDALRALNQLLQTWQTEKLVAYAENQEVFTYTPTGQKTYTIGPTGDFVTTRPIRIDFAANRDSNDNDFPFYVAKDFSDYAQITSKGVSAQLQNILYYDPTYPNGTLYVWAVPSSSSYRLVLWTWRTVTEFATLDDIISLPPGYERALRTNLAVELAPRYGRSLEPALVNNAVESKAQLKRTNMTIKTLGFDYGLTTKGGTFNWLIGLPN